MKLLISCGVFHPHQGGAESLFGDLCERFSGAGLEVSVITRRLEGTAERDRHFGAEIRRFDYPTDYEALRPHEEFDDRSRAILDELRAMIEQRRIDSVCIGLLDMSTMYLARLRTQLGFRLTIYLHGGETRVLQHESPSYRKLLLHCLRRADAVVAVSQGLAEDARRLCPELGERLHVVPNGIDVARVRRAEAFEHPRPYAFYAGRLARAKSVPRIIEGFGPVAQAEAGVDLLLAGSGDREAEARAAVARLELKDRAMFLGGRPRDDVFGLIRGARFLTLASDAEGLPIVGIEAMAAGTPLVAPRVAGVTELIEDGQNGLLFEPGDVEGYADRMLELFRSDNLHRRLSEGARQFPVERYDMGLLWREHLRILSGAASTI